MKGLEYHKLEKFAQSHTCDWYVYLKKYPEIYSFDEARDKHEVWDVTPQLPKLRPYFSPKTRNRELWQEPFGHVWIRLDNVKQTIKNWEYGSMYGLDNRIFYALTYLRSKSK